MNEQNGRDIEDLQVGMTATFAKTITEADILMFSGVSGDTNAVHVNEEYALTTPFKGRIARQWRCRHEFLRPNGALGVASS